MVPGPERLVDVRIDRAGRDVAAKIGPPAMQRADDQGREHPSSILLNRRL